MTLRRRASQLLDVIHALGYLWVLFGVGGFAIIAWSIVRHGGPRRWLRAEYGI